MSRTGSPRAPSRRPLLSVGLVMSRTISSLKPTTPVADAMQLLWVRRIRHIPVLDGTKLIGIVSDRDIKQVLSVQEDPAVRGKYNYRMPDLTVEDIMTPDPYTVSPNDPVRVAAELMAREKIGGLPVLDDNERLVGIITESDILGICATLLEFLEPDEEESA